MADVGEAVIMVSGYRKTLLSVPFSPFKLINFMRKPVIWGRIKFSNLLQVAIYQICNLP